jgi:hypothetical protein
MATPALQAADQSGGNKKTRPRGSQSGFTASRYAFQGISEQVPIRHSGAGRTKAHGTLNARRAARRVSTANHPGKSTSWTPACTGVTTCSGFT